MNSSSPKLCYCQVHRTLGTTSRVNAESLVTRQLITEASPGHNSVGLPVASVTLRQATNHHVHAQHQPRQRQLCQQHQMQQQVRHRLSHSVEGVSLYRPAYQHDSHSQNFFVMGQQHLNYPHYQNVRSHGITPNAQFLRPHQATPVAKRGQNSARTLAPDFRSCPPSPSTASNISHDRTPSLASSSRYHANAVFGHHVDNSRMTTTKKSNALTVSPLHVSYTSPTKLSSQGPASPNSSIGGGSRNGGGCCGGREFDFNKKRARSNSYSALDTVSDISSDIDHQAVPMQKGLSDRMKKIVNWMSSVGDRVGKGTSAILEAIPSLKEDHHVVMIGLDTAGKSTVLYRLKFDQYVNTVPTIGFNCEKVRGSIGKSRDLTFLVWDVGGQEKIRPLWRPYTRATDAVIFVVDSCNKERLDEARMELHRIMKNTPENSATPLLVVANKQDLPGALSGSELEKILGLSEFRQLWHLEPVCAVTGEGLDVAMEKLLELIVKKKRLSRRMRNKTR